MAYTAPTYDEYAKATQYAKIRYRYGVYIQLIAAILLLFLAYYAFTNIEEMKANPVEYAEEKLGVFCNYPPQQTIDFTKVNISLEENGTGRSIKNIKER